MHRTRVLLAALALAVLPGAAAHAQTSGAAAPAVAVKGYDVVAYFQESNARKGSPQFHTDWDGTRYYFSSAKHQAAFGVEPDRYTPQFGGYCAMGISKGKKFEADPTLWRIVDGKLYVFSSPKASDAVDKDPEILARAWQAWQALK